MRSLEKITPSLQRENLEIGDMYDFQNKIIEIWKKKFPEEFEKTLQKRQETKQALEEKEGKLANMDILDFLNLYEITTPVEINGEARIVIQVTQHFSERRIPEGYAYKGGAARSLLLINLGIDPKSIPRDIDLLRTSEKEPFEGMDHEVSQEFMPEDFANGHGVEVLNDIDAYFDSRDVTINEVLATDNEIIASNKCVRDTIRKIIRITKFEQRRFSEKILSKIIRFYSESIARYNEGAIRDIPEYRFESNFISPFWMALQLDRAFERGHDVATKFTQELIRRKQIPDDIQSPEGAAEYLSDLMQDFPFYFRHAPVQQFFAEDEWFEEQEKQHEDNEEYLEYEQFPTKESMRKNTG